VTESGSNNQKKNLKTTVTIKDCIISAVRTENVDSQMGKHWRISIPL